MKESRSLRPKIHFTPENGWMNDPNGLVFYEGQYHLFYQHDPDSLVWDTMHWGHARSRDLQNWEHLPIALFPDEMGVIYSGSCIVDTENVTGWGTKENPPLLAFYTSHNMKTMRECQCLAWSTDGIVFHKYEGNPVIPGEDHTPARDPQVFRNDMIGGYSMIITCEDRVEFYHSVNLIRWEKTGEFRLPEYALSGMIECPCLFRSNDRYVLMLSMDVPEEEFRKFPEEAVPHKRVMQYFVGTFNGTTFLTDPSQNEVLLVDYGPDFYAGTIFSNVKETILMAWLGDFSEGAKQTPTEKEGFRGIQCFPRKLTLVQTEDGYRLRHEFFFSGDKVLPDEVIYEKTQDRESLIDGCVSEKLYRNGMLPVTSYLGMDAEEPLFGGGE